MLTLDQLISSCAHETKIIKNLANHIPDGGLDYRPTPGQRSTLELMQYMTRMSAGPMCYANDNNWDRGIAMHEGTQKVTPDTFAAEMDKQMEIIREEAAKLEGKPFEDTPSAMPWQEPCTLGEFLVNAVLKTFPAYRMQYFLYLKAAGASELSTYQCWVGMDPPPPPSEG
ncbi:MAG: hypothetical protein ACYTGZ_21230 [Planctomycetota bacterium]|jgi:hypothetical protein